MAWTVCAVPPTSQARSSRVAFYNRGRSRYLSIGRDLIVRAGLAIGDLVTMEHDGTRYRIRRVDPGDPCVRGTLTKSSKGGGAKFSTGGLILHSEGVPEGLFEAMTFDGAIVFDAAPEAA